MRALQSARLMVSAAHHAHHRPVASHPPRAERPKPSCLAGGHKQTPRGERRFVHESRLPLFA